MAVSQGHLPPQAGTEEGASPEPLEMALAHTWCWTSDPRTLVRATGLRTCYGCLGPTHRGVQPRVLAGQAALSLPSGTLGPRM